MNPKRSSFGRSLDVALEHRQHAGFSDKTVKNYVSSILQKLEVQRRSEAASYMARAQAREERQPD